jgi:hypothetical protein
LNFAAQLRRKAVVQGHCHHKSLWGMDDEEQLLERLGMEVQVLDSGCCGMAGSFGFERGEKYGVSVKCAERVLLPEVRGAPDDTFIVADGFSCREQIEQLSHRRALHIAEVARIALIHGPVGPAGRPEDAYLPDRRGARLHSWKVAAVAAVIAAAGIAWWGHSRRRK